MTDQSNQVPRKSLPTTVDGLLAQRKSMRAMTLNDYVDNVHVALWDRQEYRDALDAVDDADAIEGSLADDDHIAAQMIREYARSHSVPQVASKKIATIKKSLKVVLRRYSMSRHQRAHTVGGVFVSDHVPHAAE